MCAGPIGVAGHTRSWANYFNTTPVIGVATVFLTLGWLTCGHENSASFPLGQSNIYTSRPSCWLRSVVIVYISTDHLVIWSHLMVHLIYWSHTEVLAVPGRVRDLFCTLLFCQLPCFLNTPLTHRLSSDMTFRKPACGTLWRLGQRSHLHAPRKSCAHSSLSLLRSPCGVVLLIPCWSAPLGWVPWEQVLGFLSFWNLLMPGIWKVSGILNDWRFLCYLGMIRE